MRTFRGLIFVLATIAALPSTGADRQEWSGECVQVDQGDRLIVLKHGQPVEVRVWGIDAPDVGEPYNLMAMVEASKIVSGKTVTVEEVSTVDQRKVVGIVRIDGKSVGSALVAAGAAKYDPEFGEAPDLAAAEARAKAEGRGLWNPDLEASRAALPSRGSESERKAAPKKFNPLGMSAKLPEGAGIDSSDAPPMGPQVDEPEEGGGSVEVTGFSWHFVEKVSRGDGSSPMYRIKLAVVIKNSNPDPATVPVRFQLRLPSPSGEPGAYQLADEFTQTVTVPPSTDGISVDIQADRPGYWYKDLDASNQSTYKFEAHVVAGS